MKVSYRGRRQKGNTFEREVVTEARNAGLEAKRLWGSDGRSAGYHSDVDVIIEQLTFQLKRRKRIGENLRPSEHVDGQIVRSDHSETLVLLRLADFLKILRKSD